MDQGWIWSWNREITAFLSKIFYNRTTIATSRKCQNRYVAILTLEGPPIICSRRQFQILPLFQNNK